ncbi:MAG: PilZ domain-containing protein [Candidatus Omnitrophica bacterium]|nr:PilZ domain-containing protein [Candidatus Omnitrophota bacterium]MDD5352993.1 PilZ domain-containing protein [Candidatus Omnitrophota bacterium]MDD5550592.1 PilZ domain-containing protein [Candidatus Omnitrophota bacterium]
MIYPRFKSNEVPREDSDSKKTDTQKEQRMFSRFRVNFPTRFRNLNVGRRGEGKCTDIGAGGVGIETEQELEPRTPLEMWIDVSDGFEPINLKGRVVWSQKVGAENCRTGVVFDCPRLIAFSRVLKMLRQ